MPYPNEHSCRLKPPNYKRYARKNCYQKHEGKCIDFIFGINAPNESELQAMRYKKDIWTAEDAQKHCDSQGGSFEEAASEQALAEGRWYTMKAEADEAEISIFSEIGGWGGVTVKDFKKDFDAIRGKKRIRFLLNSPGGDVFDSMAIYNILVGERNKLEVQVLGMAASGASIIALAGQELIMSRGSYLMIHNPSGLCIGDAAEMQKMADVLGKIAGQMAKIYAGESNLSREEALAAMAEETWYTADEAMEAGFADSVVDYGDVAALAPNIDRFGYAHVPQALRELAAGQSPITGTQASQPTDAAQPITIENPPAPDKGGDESVPTEDEEMKTLNQVLDALAALPEEERAKATEEDKKKIAELFGFSALEAKIAELAETSKALLEKVGLQEQKIDLLLKENEAKAKELADLKLEKFRTEKIQAIEKALAGGKIAPVNRDLWEEQYDKDPEGTRKLLENQQPVVDFSERGVATGGEEQEVMSETERKYHKALGHSEDDIKKHGGKE
jgi:ATP-dependent protease ClpP protease subunit